MTNLRFSELLDKYLTNAITESEKDQLFVMIQSGQYEPDLQNIIDQQLMHGEFDQEENAQREQLLFQKIKDAMTASPKKQTGRIVPFTWRRVAAAVAIVIVLGGSYWFVSHRKESEPAAKAETQSFKNDVEPGKYRAKLVLANGKTIILDSSTAKELAKEGNVTILNRNNQLIYETVKNHTAEVLYNTLSTGRGETYAMILSDGSRVWLNSLSSIRFPVAFTGHERKVEITGEAYFEVKHNARAPFKLVANGVEVQDLGTEFNVNDYRDEPVIKTTLVSGKANVVKGDKSHLLDPGQEIQVKNDQLIFIANADIEQATAWRDGLFRFRSTDLETVLRQVARWYNVDVNYEGKIPDVHFTGIVSRGVSLVEVLKMLELSGIHFRLNGTKLTVIS